MKTYILYGAGNNAEAVIKGSIGIFKFDYIIDRDENKWGRSICNLEIKSPDFLTSEEYKGQSIIISVSNKSQHDEIVTYLENIGIKYRERCFDAIDNIMIQTETPGRISGHISACENAESVKSYDPASFLLKPNTDKCMLRCVNDAYVEKYKVVYEKCKENGLLGKYIVNTTITDNILDLPYSLILKHEYINPISYCFEWSPEMFRDYVLFMADMLKVLAHVGLGLEDGHALNATIYKGKFIFLDFGAIKNGVTRGVNLIEYINTHLLPLLLLLKGQAEKAYLYMKNPGIQYTLADIRGYLDISEQRMIEQLYDNALYIKTQEDVIEFSEKVIVNINKKASSLNQTRWMGYQNDEWSWSNDRRKWSNKMKNVMNMIEQVKPRSIVDLAGNMGWYGTYYHTNLAYSVIVDNDENCVDYLWRRIKDEHIENVVPIKMSICTPTLDYYRDEVISETGIIPWRKNAQNRFSADLVLALAIIHHLVFSQQLTFEEVIDQILLFSKKYIIIEFIEQTDQYIWNFNKVGFEWYTKENFEEILEKKCNIISRKTSSPEETRTLYLCEK